MERRIQTDGKKFKINTKLLEFIKKINKIVNFPETIMLDQFQQKNTISQNKLYEKMKQNREARLRILNFNKDFQTLNQSIKKSLELGGE